MKYGTVYLPLQFKHGNSGTYLAFLIQGEVQVSVNGFFTKEN